MLEHYQKHIYINASEKKDILLKNIRKQLTELGIDPQAILAIVTKKYLNSSLAKTSNFLERPSNFSNIFLGAIKNVNDGVLNLERISFIRVLLQPTILSSIPIPDKIVKSRAQSLSEQIDKK